jgi:photosystem II stability/assembly factor-like uncharacterized protein
MSSDRASRRYVRYPGRWLAVAGVIVVGIVLAAIGALDADKASPAVRVSTLDTDDVHVASIVEDGLDTLIVGHHDGLVSSTDSGRTWSAGLPGVDVMAVASRADHTLLLGGHGFLGLRDVDGNYVELQPALSDDDVHVLTRSRQDPETFWLVTGAGVLQQSLDGGATWTSVADGPVVDVAADPTTTDGLWAVDAFRGLVSSTDGGRTWSDGSAVPGAPVNALAVSPDGAALLLGTGMGAFLSEDDGESWERILEEPVAAVAFEDNPDGTVVAFLVTPGGDVYRYH